ncbi:O-antigen ligase family protein [Nibrella saemangeumensis]|uniref:O-antigen ligase family protein n=1 Tax=Nibrella saemangeumensis TaxID=1084526 RepID=A0ABP8MFZ2_9BACT
MFDHISLLPESFYQQKRPWLYYLVGTLAALVAGYLIATRGVVGSVLVVLVPVAALLLIGVLLEPKIGLYLFVQLSFLVPCLTRFFTIDAPVGTSLDGILILTVVGILLNGKRMNWSRLRHPVFYVLLLWFGYNFLELFNPEAPNRVAWYVHVRAFSLYWLFVAFAILVLPITRLDIKILLGTWLTWSFFAAMWAYKQQYLGLTETESAWLYSVGYHTHLLFGRLRCFSFYSDAALFGAEMTSVTLVCLIQVIEQKKLWRKLFFLFLALVFFWGFALSGTRGALFVLLAGFPVYLIMRRDFIKIAVGICIAAPLLFLLMFTYVGNANYEIYRIRTALKPMEDPSFLLRLENQKKLANYLKDLPFGAGIGTSGDAGTRYSPDHFAAQIPPDSWYVELWIETGVVGVSFYILMILLIGLIGTYKIWRLKDPWLIKTMSSFIAVFAGIALMGYSGHTMGQLPTCSLLFTYTMLFTTCDRWEKPRQKEGTNEVAVTRRPHYEAV